MCHANCDVGVSVKHLQEKVRKTIQTKQLKTALTSNDEKQRGDARLHVFAGEININTSAGGSQCDNKGGN